MVENEQDSVCHSYSNNEGEKKSEHQELVSNYNRGTEWKQKDLCLIHSQQPVHKLFQIKAKPKGALTAGKVKADVLFI